MMKDEDVGLAPIVEGDRLVGTLTDRDIVTRVVAEGKDPQTVTVREVASTDLVTIDPEQKLDEALKLMAQNQIRRLPVVEEDGKLVGVLAQADVAREAKDKGMSKERAAKIANSKGSSSRGGKSSGSGSSSRSNSRQGGTTAQKKAAGRKGGKAAARKS
jgi:signal-transduction protein with cAMP-binding, CBS, and nucleotidyltransferase domain